MKVVFLVPALLNATEASGSYSSLSPHLMRWMTACPSFAKAKTETTIVEWWSHAFGIPPACSAPWLALDDGYGVDHKYWVNVAFGHLHVTLNSTSWVPVDFLGVRADQLTKLSEHVLSCWLAEETWHVGKSGRSYISSLVDISCPLPDPSYFMGNAFADLYSDAGYVGKALQKLQNELGMLLHGLPACLRSTMSNTYLINSAYFYGAGLFSQQIGLLNAHSNWHVYSHYPLAIALAKRSQCRLYDDFHALQCAMLSSSMNLDSVVIIQLDALRDFSLDDVAWAQARIDIDKQWFSLANRLYDKGIITQLEIMVGKRGGNPNELYRMVPIPPHRIKRVWNSFIKLFHRN